MFPLRGLLALHAAPLSSGPRPLLFPLFFPSLSQCQVFSRPGDRDTAHATPSGPVVAFHCHVLMPPLCDARVSLPFQLRPRV